MLRVMFIKTTNHTAWYETTYDDDDDDSLLTLLAVKKKLNKQCNLQEN